MRLQRRRAVNGNVLPPPPQPQTSRVLRLVPLILPILFIACAENRLHTYMLIQTPGPALEKKDAKKRSEIELSPKPLLLTMLAARF